MCQMWRGVFLFLFSFFLLFWHPFFATHYAFVVQPVVPDAHIVVDAQHACDARV